MGMNNGSGPYWKQMLEAGKLSEEQFALCYSRQPTAAREGTEAGALTMGGVDTRLHETDMVYSSGAIIGRDSYWNVKIRKIFFRDGSAGERVVPTDKKATIIQLDLDNNHRDAIVDSGTTDTYLTKKLAASFTAVFEKLTGRKYSNTAWSLTEEELEAFPAIIFQLESESSSGHRCF
jgi:hypothetical protein